MFPPEVLEELKKLNANLEGLREDVAVFRPLVVDIRELKAKLGNMGKTAKQLQLLNQILLQTKKSAGTIGMIQALINSLLTAERRRARG